MGQRANYIIQQNGQYRIYYSHWRANRIAEDLYLGEKRFIEYVISCERVAVLMDNLWIEGFVLLDLDSFFLGYWFCEDKEETAVTNYYLEMLGKRWKGWKIQRLTKRMYDVEQLLGIEYIAKQSFKFEAPTLETVLTDGNGKDWVTSLVIIKDNGIIKAIYTENLDIEYILNFGVSIIEHLQIKTAIELPIEERQAGYQYLIIDADCLRLTVAESIAGLWENCSSLWQGYTLDMRDMGYMELLEIAGIPVANLRMSQERVVECYEHIIKRKEDFDPHAFADRLIQESPDKDIRFTPSFFDIQKPRFTLAENIRRFINRLFSV